MTAELDDKVTALAKTALEKKDSWVTVVVLMLWCWWMSYQVNLLTRKLQAQAQEALEARLAAEEQARRVAESREQGLVDLAALKVADAHATYVAREKDIRESLEAAEVVKARISKLKKWEDLDALANGH